MKKKIIKWFILIMTMVLTFTMGFGSAFASTTTRSPYIKTTSSNPNANVFKHSSVFDNRIKVNGIDVSAYQNDIDWNKVKADGIDFAIIRVAGRGYGAKGNMYYDDCFRRNISNAKKAGLIVGVYFFSQAITQTEARAEVKYARSVLDDYSIDLPFFMDYEYAKDSANPGRLNTSKLTKAQKTSIVRAFCNAVKSAGYDPGVYANLLFMENSIDGKALSAENKFMWVAQYNKTCDYAYDYDMWQYSSKGHVSGISGNVDCDYWYPEQTPKATQSKSIANCSITTSECLYYGAKNYEPTVTVKYGDTTLTRGVDYTVGYINNRKTGTAYAYVAGKGQYADYKLAPFKIEKAGAGNGLITPTVSAANDQNGYISVKWNQVPDAEKYEVFRATEKDGTFQLYTTTKSLSFTNSGAAKGKTYYYKVRAIGTADGSQVRSNMSTTVHCTDRSRLARPAVTSGNNANGQIQLKWAKVPGAEKYEIYRSGYKDGTYSYMYTTQSTSYANTSAAKGKTYFYKVRAVDTNGAAVKSYLSEIVRGSDKTRLATPTVKSANNSDGYIRITWNKVSGAEKYEVYRSGYKNGTYKLYSTASGTAMTNTKAGKGATYFYKVRAVDGDGTAAKSYFSSIAKGTDKSRLVRPSVTSGNNSNGQIQLKWAKVPGAEKYEIYRSGYKNGTYSYMYTTKSTSYVNTSASKGKTYYYKVRAVDTNGSAQKSYFTSPIKGRDRSRLTAPTVKASGDSRSRIRVTWNKISGAEKYYVYRATSKSGTYKHYYTTKNTYFNNSSATRGKTYFYKVKAIDTDGAAKTSYYSNTASGKRR